MSRRAFGEPLDCVEGSWLLLGSPRTGGAPWPVIVSLFVANGWFLKPRAVTSPKNAALAGLRLLAFAGVWVAAFAWLPALPVAAALVGWIAYITPKLRWLNQQFQHVEAPAPPAAS